MFCRNCGTQINDGDLFCIKCGARVAADAAAEPEGKAEAVKDPQETVLQDAIPQETTPGATAQAAPEQPVKAAPKKKGKKWKILIPVAAVAAVAVLVAVNFSKLSNFVTKTVLPADKYYSKVESAQIEELAASIADSYENAFQSSTNLTDVGVNTNITLELGEEARELIGDYAYLDDTDWLEKIGLNMNVSVNEDMIGASGAALLGKDQLISIAALMDIDNLAAYLQVPELSEKYIGVDLGNFDMELNYDSGIYDEFMDLYQELYEVFPDKKVVEDLISRYLMIAVNSLDNVKKSTDVLEVEDIEQKCTVLRVKIGQKDLLNILEAILEEAKDDKDLMKVISDFAAAVPYEYGMDADDIEDAFKEGIEDLLEDLEYAKEYADSDSKIVMQVWINSAGEVVGRDVSLEDSFELKYYMPQEGSDFAMELSFTDGYDTFAVTGEGKKTASGMSGEFVVEFSGMELVEIVVEDYALKGEELKGKFSVKPTEELWYEMDLGIPTSMVSDYALVLEMNMNAEKSEMAISLDHSGNMFAGITISATTGSGKMESVSESNAVMIESEEDLIEWLGTIDFDGFLNKIRKTSLPDEFIGLIESYCFELEDALDYYYYY